MAATVLAPEPLAAPVGFTTVTATRVTDSSGNLITNATAYFQPCDMNGNWLAYCVNSSGQSMWESVSTQVVNGAFTVVLADTKLTSPQNIYFQVRIYDNVSNADLLGPNYFIQPTGSTWNFDNFIPNIPNLPPVLGSLAGDIFMITSNVKEQSPADLQQLNDLLNELGRTPITSLPSNYAVIKSPAGYQVTLSRTPITPVLIGLYYNGILQLPGIHYSLAGRIVTVNFPTLNGDNLYASYMATAAA